MPDNLSSQARSYTMSRIRSIDTGPEKSVRSFLHSRGYRFRLHCKKLPGKPDIVLPRHRIVVFVHGCFWHRHPNCKFATVPKTAAPYWTEKFRKTIKRDQRNTAAVRGLGWRVIVIWECEVRNDTFRDKLNREL